VSQRTGPVGNYQWVPILDARVRPSCRCVPGVLDLQRWAEWEDLSEFRASALRSPLEAFLAWLGGAL
jgi:hypothetical protein